MARKAKKEEPKKKTLSELEAALWKSADKLRGSVDPTEYKYVVLSLIFLKYANDKFDEHREKLIADGKKNFLEITSFYTKDNVFYIPEEARWDYLKSVAKEAGLALKIDKALHAIETKNKSLAGALPNNYFSRLNLNNASLGSLLDKIASISQYKVEDGDVFGHVYEYFLKAFAMQEGKKKGEFYTPKTVVQTLCELIEPYKGICYDGACGSGGMFVSSMEFINAHKGSRKNISIYAQESNQTTMQLSKMNLAIRGIACNMGEKAASTFTDDQHPDLKADYILMNPPFNLKDWRDEDELTDDARWKGYEVPAPSNANYAWLLNAVAKLSDNGVAGILLANGALGSDDGPDPKIRRQLIENDLVEAIIVLPRNMFYTTDISCTIWILNKNKNAHHVQFDGIDRDLRNRHNKVLFVDLRTKGHEGTKKHIEFDANERKKIADLYHGWQTGKEYSDVAELCYSATKEEIASNDYSLVPSKYIEFVDHDMDIDYPKEMARIQKEMHDIIREEKESQKMLEDAFRGIGYDID